MIPFIDISVTQTEGRSLIYYSACSLPLSYPWLGTEESIGIASHEPPGTQGTLTPAEWLTETHINTNHTPTPQTQPPTHIQLPLWGRLDGTNDGLRLCSLKV